MGSHFPQSWNLNDIGSMEKRASTYIFAKLQNVSILKFSEFKSSFGKIPTTFIAFHTHYDDRQRLSINKDLF